MLPLCGIQPPACRRLDLGHRHRLSRSSNVSSPSSPLLTLILLLLLANGGPVLMALFFGRDRANTIDGGRLLRDGYPILGPSKTWRGLTSALLLTSVASWGLGWGWALGLTVALAAMAGDLLVSFTKRRLGLPSGASVPLLDQVARGIDPGPARTAGAGSRLARPWSGGRCLRGVGPRLDPGDCAACGRRPRSIGPRNLKHAIDSLDSFA